MSKSVFDMLFEMVRTRKPVPGESGVQRISWAYGQVALDRPSFDPMLLREMVEQAVCAGYEREIDEIKRGTTLQRTEIELREMTRERDELERSVELLRADLEKVLSANESLARARDEARVSVCPFCKARGEYVAQACRSCCAELDNDNGNAALRAIEERDEARAEVARLTRLVSPGPTWKEVAEDYERDAREIVGRVATAVRKVLGSTSACEKHGIVWRGSLSDLGTDLSAYIMTLQGKS